MSVSVCVFVCLSASSKYTSDLYQIFVHVTYGRGSVLLWLRCDTLCTSGFMDDVILADKPRQVNVATQLMEAQPTCSLGLGYRRRVGIPVAVQWTHALTSLLSGTEVWAYEAAVGVLNIHDIMFAHNVLTKMTLAKSNSIGDNTGGGVCDL